MGAAQRYCLNNPITTLSFALADGVIGLACWYLARELNREAQAHPSAPNLWKNQIFSILLLLAGTYHLSLVVDLWYPWYELSSLVGFLTAGAAVATAKVYHRRRLERTPDPTGTDAIRETPTAVLVAELARRGEKPPKPHVPRRY